MKRFDVCPAGKFAGAGKDRLVVVLQYEALGDLTTTIVAPLYKTSEYRVVRHLTPLVDVGRQRLVVAIDRLAFVPKGILGKPVANVESARLELLRATDMLFSGLSP